MDILSIVGVLIAFVAIIGGNIIEGGEVSALLNLPAAMIVVGGTIGAISLQHSAPVLKRSLIQFGWVFLPPYINFQSGIDKLINWSMVARKEGLLGLEEIAEKEPDPFSRKGLQLLVDGAEPESIRNVMELELGSREQRDLNSSKVYEAMGGYAPTLGILGAVLGLIQVMRHLEDPSMLGPGIATAFVATIYGVALANLFYFPIANKLKGIVYEQSLYREMMIEGVVAIAEGENPKAIELKLKGFIDS
ncbi:flagellar motor protein [Hahella sp. CCB-MM4]|uniref:flagellar motor protein n=1 Tax=Hahella sp. (strain CCB-MM4) TaxID=1926491 RepID=UPI000B9AB97E|nr:flagellar motor protein [Hahella sp. CCB-MM4]OZG72867.1 flagellar motor protein [Hahella sp. CCB-MM4]